MGLEVVEALTPCTKQPQKQDVRFRQTTAAMLEVLTYTPSIADNMITEQAGTHVAKLVGAIMISFRFAACGALAIAASSECGLHDYEVI